MTSHAPTPKSENFRRTKGFSLWEKLAAQRTDEGYTRLANARVFQLPPPCLFHLFRNG
jgi:hypothetical protein